MNLYSLPFVVSMLGYLSLGVWVFFRRKDRSHTLYSVLCLITCLWQGMWAMLFSHIDASAQLFWLRVCYTGIVFLPAILYQLMATLVQKQALEKRWIFLTYGISAVFLGAVWYDSLFVKGFQQYVWGSSAKAGPLHPLFGLLVAAVIARIGILLWQFHKSHRAHDVNRKQMYYVGFAILSYCGGALDLLSQYGISFFPVSFIFLSVSLVLFGYAILRHDFLVAAGSGEAENERPRREAASSEMRELEMAAAFPLVSQGEVMGYLLLGEKMSEESYSKEDLLLLRIVANQAALGYQRVRYLEMAVNGARTEILGQIAGGFAHEIKTPLANISLPAELTIMDLEDLEQGRRSAADLAPVLKARMKDIMKQAFKASEKIEAVRQFSKPGEVRLEPVDLRGVIQNSIGLLDHLVHQTGIQIKQDFPEVLNPVRGDAKQLEIIFVNLIKNAAEAMAQHKTDALARVLILKAKNEGEWVIASVKDSGPGIRKTHIGHLFDAYFTTKGSEGTGMGLFLSHQVIKAHGGSIDVNSEEGQGTEFVIRLPKFVAQERGLYQAA